MRYVEIDSARDLALFLAQALEAFISRTSWRVLSGPFNDFITNDAENRLWESTAQSHLCLEGEEGCRLSTEELRCSVDLGGNGLVCLVFQLGQGGHSCTSSFEYLEADTFSAFEAIHAIIHGLREYDLQ